MRRSTSSHRPKQSAVARVSFAPDRKSTRLNSSHLVISYAVFCLKKKNKQPLTYLHLPHTTLNGMVFSTFSPYPVTLPECHILYHHSSHLGPLAPHCRIRALALVS